jgi:hypothetical protein
MTNEPSSEQPELPALSDAELRETLDRLGDLSLRVYDKVQEKTKAINHVATAANEARHAAKKAEQQTDPEQYADFAVRLIDERTGEILGKMNQTSSDVEFSGEPCARGSQKSGGRWVRLLSCYLGA